MDLKYYENLKQICTKSAVCLVAVSKTKPKEDIQILYNLNQRIFGENKVQELVEKYEFLPKDIEWHFIGHLQKNKIKYIAPFVNLIHAVDSIELLTEIDKRAAQNNRIINCLVQFHIAKEETKFGLDKSEIKSFFEEALHLKNIRIIGVMGMATFTENEYLIRTEFKLLKDIFNLLQENYFADKLYFKEISMGMSGDFEIAIQEGSTMIRIGSSIFGSR